MELHTIGIEDFRVFEKIIFEFPQEPGLYLLTGDNRDRPELGSNGVGKSSLWDAVCFTLYGESTRGLKGTDLVRDGCTEIRAVLTTDLGPIERVWSSVRKNVLRFKTKDISQDELNRTFGLDIDAFIATTIVPQSTPLFIDLPPTAQVSVLQRLLGIERWITYADKAAKRVASLEKLAAAVAGALASQRSGLARLGDVRSLEADSSQWEKDQFVRTSTLADALADAQEAAAGESPKLGEAKAKVAPLESSIKRADSNIKVMERSKAAFDVEMTNAYSLREQANKDMNRLAQRLAFFLKTPVCPTCDQPIDATYKDKCQEVIEREGRVLEASHTEHDRVYQAARAEVNRLGLSIQETRVRLRTLESNLSQVRREIAVEEQRIGSLGGMVFAAQRALDNCKNSINPHQGAIIRAREERKGLEEEVARLEIQVANDTRALEAVKVWTRGFRSIRSQLVSEGLAQFGIEIAAVLEDLGLVGWQVHPTVDPSVFESARIQTGFKFQVVDPMGVSRPVDAYSGGELQRVRLAIQLGLGALVASVNGAAWNLEVWDEPSTYLSEEGILGLFDSLEGRAARLAKPIWVIDHHQIHYSNLTRVYSVVREHNRAEIT